MGNFVDERYKRRDKVLYSVNNLILLDTDVHIMPGLFWAKLINYRTSLYVAKCHRQCTTR